LGQLTKRLVERAMEVELTDHLGYEPHQEPTGGAGNTRNGSMPKTLITEQGPVRVNTPRDRDGSFEPQIVRKRQRRFEGFDDKILALYSRGLSTRDIEAHLEEIYGVRVGRDLISRVTDAVMEDARAWQTRPLDDVYPVVFLDALVLKIRDGGSVQRRACYLALAITIDGEREVLGMWFQANEGAKFWMQVLTDLKQRGVGDILICCVDGLKGFPEAIEAIYPQTTVQTCIVHYADPAFMPTGVAGAFGGGRMGLVGVGIITVRRGTRGCGRGAGSGRVLCPAELCGRVLSL
jgi:putative transposase